MGAVWDLPDRQTGHRWSPQGFVAWGVLWGVSAGPDGETGRGGTWAGLRMAGGAGAVPFLTECEGLPTE